MGKVVAAFSVSSTIQYMGDDRMLYLAEDVRQVAVAISQALGWSSES